MDSAGLPPAAGAVGARVAGLVAFLAIGIACSLVATGRSLPDRIGPGAVWSAAQHDDLAASATCHPSFTDRQRPCIDRYMRAHRATPAAVAF